MNQEHRKSLWESISEIDNRKGMCLSLVDRLGLVEAELDSRDEWRRESYRKTYAKHLSKLDDEKLEILRESLEGLEGGIS